MIAEPRRFTGFSTGFLFCCILFGVIFLDLLSKDLAFKFLRLGMPHRIIPGLLSFTLSLNAGAVFGVGQGMRALFVVFTLIAAAGILWVLWAHGRSSRLLTYGLALVLGGALGNLWDRLFNDGKVRDFIDVYAGGHHWPTFNVADTAICVGAGLIILYSLRKPKATDQNAASK